MRAQEAGAPGHDDPAHSAPDPGVGEAHAAHGSRVEQVAGVDDGGLGHDVSTRAKSSQRNSSHSVSTTSTRAPGRRLVRVGTQLHAVQVRATSMSAVRRWGRRPARWRPRSARRWVICRLGESRRSSVLALKVRPHTATVTPSTDPPQAAPPWHHPGELLVVGGDGAGQQREVVARLPGDVQEGPGVLGQTRPAPARSGPQELEADALVVAQAEQHVAQRRPPPPRRARPGR